MARAAGFYQRKAGQMKDANVFQSALSNFATDVACGGAIRHLTDIGYTLDQIVARLDYPVSREKAQRIMMEYLYQSRMLLREEPSETLFEEQTRFVQEQDAFGRRTLRKVKIDYNSQNKMTNTPDLTTLSQREEAAKTWIFLWKESLYDPRRDGKLTELLHRKCEKYGETYSYISCPFGKKENDQNSQNKNFKEEISAKETMSCLNGRQREYLAGIRWEQPVLYHRLNRRMLEIISKLYEAGVYGGTCYFAAGQEKLTIPVRLARG